MNKNSLASNTIKTYEYVFNKYVDKKNIKYPNKIVNDLKNDYSLDTIRTVLSSILFYLKKNNNNSDLILKYQDLLNNIRNKTNKDTNDHNITKQLIIPDWNDLIKLKDKYYNLFNDDKYSNKKRNMFYNKYLCVCLYTMMAPRREMDYAKMIILNDYNEFINYIKNFINIKNLKYYCKEDNSNDKIIKYKDNDKKILNNFYLIKEGIYIFCNYKTFKNYGFQIIKVNDDLKKIIDDYINYYKLKSKDKLFFNKNLHILINETFKTDDNIPISINSIRHSFIKHFYDNIDVNNIVSEIENISKLMGHSVHMDMNYYKNNNTKTN